MSRRSLIYLFVGLITLVLMFLQPYKLVVVVGPSMEPTYKSGQLLLAKRSTRYNVGDVIVVKTYDGIIIKRIAFTEGQIYYNRLNTKKEEIELVYGPVLYDQLMNDHEQYSIHSLKVPLKHYFVLGDNWDNSEDSRFFGTITKDQILYKVID